MEGLSYSFLFGGQSQQLSRFLDAFDESLSPHLESLGVEEVDSAAGNRPELTFERRVTADAGVSTAVIGLVFFVAGWAGNHILDELFEDRFKEGLKGLISKARKNILLSRTEPIEYRSVICKSEDYPTVVIRLKVEIDDTLSGLTDSIKFAHAHAERWIAVNGRKAEIHCHTIVSGQCNLEPDFYSNIKEIDTEKKRAEVRDWDFMRGA